MLYEYHLNSKSLSHCHLYSFYTIPCSQFCILQVGMVGWYFQTLLSLYPCKWFTGGSCTTQEIGRGPPFDQSSLITHPDTSPCLASHSDAFPAPPAPLTLNPLPIFLSHADTFCSFTPQSTTSSDLIYHSKIYKALSFSSVRVFLLSVR